MDLARMRVMVIAVAAVAVAATAAGVVLVVRADRHPPNLVFAGDVDELRDNGVTYVPVARTFVASTGDGLLGLYARSPHRGQPITYCESSGWFRDRRHGSMFDALGRYVLGPASRGLDRFEVVVEGGEVWIDTDELLLGPPRGAHDPPPTTLRCS